jgi:hypothetical protein
LHGEKRNVNRILVGSPEWKLLRFGVDGSMPRKENGRWAVDLIHVAEDRARWRDLAKTAMDLP